MQIYRITYRGGRREYHNVAALRYTAALRGSTLNDALLAVLNRLPGDVLESIETLYRCDGRTGSGRACARAGTVHVGDLDYCAQHYRQLG